MVTSRKIEKLLVLLDEPFEETLERFDLDTVDTMRVLFAAGYIDEELVDDLIGEREDAYE